MSNLGTIPPEDAGAGTSHFLKALRGRFWIPLLCAALVGGGAYAYASRQHRHYQATALLQVNDASIEQEIVGITNSNLSFENVVAELPPQVHQLSVARQAAPRVSVHPPMSAHRVLAATEVTVDQQTGLIPVSATAATGPLAASIANAMANAYVEMRQTSELRQIHRARLKLQALAEARARGNLRRPAAASDLSSLTDRIQQLQLTEQIRPQSVSVARSATPPSSRSGMSPVVIAALGAMVGGVGGFGLAALLAQADERLRSARELERALRTMVLAVIPRSRALARRRELDELADTDREAFRVLLARVRHGQAASACRSVVLTATKRREGTSTVAWYLAATAAASGTRTALLEVRPAAVAASGARAEEPAPAVAVALNGQEAGNGHDPGADGRLHTNDLSHPSESHLVSATAHHEPASATATVGETAKLVGTPSRPIGSDVPRSVGPEPRDGKHAGSATAISEALLDPPVAVQVADGRQLDTIRARGDQLARLLAHPQDAAELLAGLGYDVLVIDAPPLATSADAVPFACAADSVVVVTRKGVVDATAAELLREALDDLGVNVAGTVAIGFRHGENYG